MIDEHEHHEKHPYNLDDARCGHVNSRYERSTVNDYKLCMIDILGELIQQVARLRTEKCNKRELIKYGLMAEDHIDMLWKLMTSDKALIEEVKKELYTED